VFPSGCRGKERVSVTIEVRPAFAGLAFCIFGAAVVRRHVRNDLLRCRAPEHAPGGVDLSVSVGSEDRYFGAAPFAFDRDPWFSWNFVLVPLAIAISVVALLFLFACCAVKPRVPGRRKRRPAALNQSLKERKDEEAAVNRRNPVSPV